MKKAGKPKPSIISQNSSPSGRMLILVSLSLRMPARGWVGYGIRL